MTKFEYFSIEQQKKFLMVTLKNVSRFLRFNHENYRNVLAALMQHNVALSLSYLLLISQILSLQKTNFIELTLHDVFVYKARAFTYVTILLYCETTLLLILSHRVVRLLNLTTTITI